MWLTECVVVLKSFVVVEEAADKTDSCLTMILAFVMMTFVMLAFVMLAFVMLSPLEARTSLSG